MHERHQPSALPHHPNHESNEVSQRIRSKVHVAISQSSNVCRATKKLFTVAESNYEISLCWTVKTVSVAISTNNSTPIRYTKRWTVRSRNLMNYHLMQSFAQKSFIMQSSPSFLERKNSRRSRLKIVRSSMSWTRTWSNEKLNCTRSSRVCRKRTALILR